MNCVSSVIENSRLQPRPYMYRICSKTVGLFHGEHVHEQTQVLEPAVKSVMIESPTGSGKTCMALTVAKALQTRTPDLHFGWVAMRHNLLNQAARENHDKGIKVDNIDFVSMFDKNPEKLIQAKLDGKRICMIIDECQHDAASSMAHLHNVVEPDLILGMTATPFRTDKMKLCFQKVVKDCGIHQLIQDGYLSKYHHYTIDEWTPENIANHYCAEPDRWGKSIFFFLNTDECNELGYHFAKNGVRYEIVKGGQQRITDEQLCRFENGEVDCLINCMVLTEGFDCPSLKTAWVRDSSKGPTIQMGGRAFRKFEGLPIKQIVQSKQTKWPFIRTAMPLQQFIWTCDEWRTLEINPNLDRINQTARMGIAMTEVTMPKFIADKKSKRPIRVRF